MKRSYNKEINIVTIVVLLAMAFLWIFTFVYSYFTASHTINDPYQFSNINVKFNYVTSGNINKVNNKGTIELQPRSIIKRGEKFSLSYNGTDVSSVGFSLSNDSCAVFIRYWIDAYKVLEDGSVDTSVNYGKYFMATRSGNELAYNDEVNIGTGASAYQNTIYYVEDALYNGSNDVIAFDALTLAVDCDTNLIGSSVKILISFDAVQAENEAYLDAFDDDKGYWENWSYEAS